jgi:hypothetical protein
MTSYRETQSGSRGFAELGKQLLRTGRNGARLAWVIFGGMSMQLWRPDPRSKRERRLIVTDLRKENPKLDPAPGSNTAKPPEEWVSGSEPMTGAQASYLTTLCEEAKRKPPAGDLTKAEASKLIDELKAELRR